MKRPSAVSIVLRVFLVAALAIAALGAQAQTLSASPATAYTGQSVTAAWSGIPAPTAADWIGLYPVGAADNAFIAWRYTDGSAAGSAPLAIPVNATPGTYELRLFSNNSFTRLAVSNSFGVQTPPQANLSVSPTSIFASQSVTATWSAIFQPTTTDWIGLYLVGAADSAFLSWQYTDGSAAGSDSFEIPGDAPTGTYELRLFSNDTFSRLAVSNSVAVQAVPPANLSVSPTSIFASQSVTATWSAIFAPTAQDWIGLFPVGAADNAFVAWHYTDGSAAGSAPFGIPGNAPAGTYELRLFTDNSTTRLAVSNSFTVQAVPPATLSVSPASVAPGGSVTASYTSIFAPTPNDWIGLYAPNAADNAFVAWRYTDGSAAGSVPFAIATTVPPGTYQLRLFTNNSLTRLAVSGNFSVGGATTLYYIETDQLNTPRQIFDQNQTLVWKWDNQEPFGADTPNGDPNNTGTTFDLPLRLPGQVNDTETGLNYNYLRDCYDPATGRYCESDPLGLAAGLNVFAYANGTPLTSFDRSGLLPGDNFKFEIDAALDAHNFVQGYPESRNYEIAVTIYRTPEGMFSYTPPSTNWDPVKVRPPAVPPDTIATADYHNHIPVPPGGWVLRPNGERVLITPEGQQQGSDDDHSETEKSCRTGYIGLPNRQLLIIPSKCNPRAPLRVPVRRSTFLSRCGGSQ